MLNDFYCCLTDVFIEVFFSTNDILCYPLLRCNSDYQVHVMGHVPYVS
jgi:hypothetical protein